MKTFEIGENISAVCESQKTRYGFRHIARLFYHNHEVKFAKVCYYNRTWESFEFESVLQKLLDKQEYVSEDEKKEFFGRADKANRHEVDSMMKTVAFTAKLGEMLCQDKKEKNDWKARMLKAGLPGLELPEDWESLSEDEKEARLNKIIGFCNVKDE